jgi:predicted ArsR family transcriptional regulator
MTTETKSQIIAAILKQKEFKAGDITRAVGCSRQLVNHHLKRLVTKGVLNKDGMYYSIVDDANLIDQLTAGDSRRTLEQTPFLSSIKQERLKNILLHAQVMMLPNNIQVKRTVLEDIEKSIRSLTNLRYMLTNVRLDPKSSRKALYLQVDRDFFLDTYVKYNKDFGHEVNRREIEIQLDAALNEED